MTFRSDLLAALKADLVTAAVVSADTEAFTGETARTPQSTAAEVWIEELGTPQPSGSLQRVRVHELALHLRYAGNKGAAQAWSELQATAQAAGAALVERYDGELPFAGSLTDCVGLTAELEGVFELEGGRGLEAVVQLGVAEKE